MQVLHLTLLLQAESFQISETSSKINCLLAKSSRTPAISRNFNSRTTTIRATTTTTTATNNNYGNDGQLNTFKSRFG